VDNKGKVPPLDTAIKEGNRVDTGHLIKERKETTTRRAGKEFI